jgi:hypothetical protein
MDRIKYKQANEQSEYVENYCARFDLKDVKGWPSEEEELVTIETLHGQLRDLTKRVHQLECTQGGYGTGYLLILCFLALICAIVFGGNW